jgi:hypothetical protein
MLVSTERAALAANLGGTTGISLPSHGGREFLFAKMRRTNAQET